MGVRGDRKSEAEIRRATTKATVVKKPKVFWRRTREEYIVMWWVRACAVV